MGSWNLTNLDFQVKVKYILTKKMRGKRCGGWREITVRERAGCLIKSKMMAVDQKTWCSGKSRGKRDERGVTSKFEVFIPLPQCFPKRL